MDRPQLTGLPGPTRGAFGVVVLLALVALWLAAPQRPDAGLYEAFGRGGTIASWVAVAVALGALLVAIWSLRTNRASLRLNQENARKADQQRAEEAERRAQLRADEERRQTDAERERVAFLAQFEEVPLPPREDGTVFVWRYPRDWAPREDPPEFWAEEGLFDLMVSIWSLPDRRPKSGFDPRQHPNRPAIDLDFVYLTDATRKWRRPILHGRTHEHLLGTAARKGDMAPRVCIRCRHITAQNCPKCGTLEQDLPRADALRPSSADE